LKTTITVGLAALWAAAATTPAHATVITLFDYAFNIDGGITEAADALPPNLDSGGFDFGTGLGRIDVTITGAGAHNVTAFFDHEIDELINTFFNEFGGTGGTPVAGQSWEIDEPGFLFGDIYSNLFDNSLDDSNGIALLERADDVSMALGFDFSLNATQTAIASFFLSTVNNAPGFFLTHLDPDSIAEGFPGPNQLFFWGALDIRGGVVEPPPPVPVPEPTTLALLVAGLLSFGLRRRHGRGGH
jgi:hypothetical protein